MGTIDISTRVGGAKTGLMNASMVSLNSRWLSDLALNSFSVVECRYAYNILPAISLPVFSVTVVVTVSAIINH